MALPYHMSAGSTEHGPATMFRTGLTQLKDLPAQFIAAFNSNVRTPYRTFDPTGEVIVDRDGRFVSSLYTSLPDRTPLKNKATKPQKNEEKKAAAEEKKRIQDSINKAMAPERKAKDAQIKALQAEVQKLKESLKSDDRSMEEVVASLISDPETKSEALKILKEGEKEKDAAVVAVLEDKIDDVKSEKKKTSKDVKAEKAEFLIKTPDDIPLKKLNSIFDKLGIKGLKGAKTPVKVKIAKRLEKITSVPFAGLGPLSKSKLPSKATEFVSSFNDRMDSIRGDKKIITDKMFEKFIKK